MLEHYLAHRRFWEVGGVIALLSIGFAATLNTEYLELARYGVRNEFWEVAVWEATSHVALGISLLLMLWFRSCPAGLRDSHSWLTCLGFSSRLLQ